MSLNPIGLAVPFFFMLMLLELLISVHRGRQLYRLNDAIADLTCGMGDQVIGIFFKGLTLALYTAVFTGVGMLDLQAQSPWTWLVGMVGVDFFYYWYHRFSHRVHWAWATHAVHHQSEEYNLAVALRQPWFTQLYGWIFYLPLAVLGLPPVVWITCYSVNLLYQFWIHTQLIGTLGPAEWVMNTPSHHRVHHGTNPAYIDKNYAGIFIVWDRLFGTFTKESEVPMYGTLVPLRSWNPLWANVGPFVGIARLASSHSGWQSKLMAWWGPPGWTPDGEVHPPFPAPDRGYDARSIPALGPYVVAHLIPVATATAMALTFDKQAPLGVLLLAGIYIIWTGMGWAGLFERRRWAVSLELCRLVAVGAAALVWGAGQSLVAVLLAVTVVIMCVASAAWVWSRRAALVA
jgi:sterol desaturase/sphingolipid hydroxylase (fatty acid hydroxylase superfamily)